MSKSSMWRAATILIIVAMALAACSSGQPEPVVEEPSVEEPVAEEPAAEEPAAEEPAAGGFEIPAVEEGMFNVAMVLIGPHDDGGW